MSRFRKRADKSERIALAKMLRREAASYESNLTGVYDHFGHGFIAGLENAADLLDAQAEYDNNTELQETLERSSNSETVIRSREPAGED